MFSHIAVSLPFAKTVQRSFFILLCGTFAGNAYAIQDSDLLNCANMVDKEESLNCFKGLTKATAVGSKAEKPIEIHKPKTEAAPPKADMIEQTEEAAEAERKAQRQRDRAQLNFAHERLAANMDPSYLTFGSGVHLGADQTSTHFFYEGQIFKNLAATDGTFRPFADIAYWIDIPIRIGVRHFNDYSKPVKTPTYNPGLRIFIAPNWATQSADLETEKRLTYFSFGLHHYSNGQAVDGTLPDGSVNTNNGHFSTNYAELAGNVDDLSGPLQLGRLALRQQFYGTFEPFQQDQYPRRSMFMELRSHDFFKETPLLVQLRATGEADFGYHYVVKNDVYPNRNIEAKWSDRLGAKVELLLMPRFFDDVAFYIRYDYGHDYYNINFQNRMNRIQFGISSK